MSNELIKTILLQHGQYVKLLDGLIYAWDEYTKDTVLCGSWVNVTGFSKKELMNYLNY